MSSCVRVLGMQTAEGAAKERRRLALEEAGEQASSDQVRAVASALALAATAAEQDAKVRRRSPSLWAPTAVACSCSLRAGEA